MRDFLRRLGSIAVTALCTFICGCLFRRVFLEPHPDPTLFTGWLLFAALGLYSFSQTWRRCINEHAVQLQVLDAIRRKCEQEAGTNRPQKIEAQDYHPVAG